MATDLIAKKALERLRRAVGAERVDAEPAGDEYGAVTVRIESSTDLQRALVWAQSEGVTTYLDLIEGEVARDFGGLFLDLRPMDALIEVNEISRIVTAQTGIRVGELEVELNERGFSLGPIPPPVYHRPLAYWLLDRDTGVGASGWGAIGSNVMAMAGRFPNGEGFDTRRTPRASTGPDFCKFLIGTEGYFAIPTEATLIATARPESRRHQCYRMRSLDEGLTALREIVVQGLRPTYLNLLDGPAARELLRDDGVNGGGALLTLGFEGPTTIVQAGEEIAAKLAETEGGKPAGNELAERWHRIAWAPQDPERRGEGPLDDRYTVSVGWRQAATLHGRLRRSFAREGEGLRVIYGQAGLDGLQAVVQIDGGDRYDADEARRELLRILADVGADLVHELAAGDSVPVDRESEYGPALEWLSAVGDRLDPAGVYQGAVW